MGVMHLLMTGLGLAVVVVAQGKESAATQPPAATASPSGSLSPVRFASNGWPVGLSDTPAPPSAELGRPLANRKVAAQATTQPAPTGSGDVLVAAGTADEPLASGMQLDSPLHEVFRATRSPGALHAIGGVEVIWRLSIHGTHGEIIGTRDITQIADCNFPERDRLEDAKGRVFTRDGNQVRAQRNGIPYESLHEEAKAMLELFGLQLRMPWCFGDGKSYSIMAREVANRRGEDLVKLQLQRRTAQSALVFGPEANPEPTDQFELLFEPTTGQPRELLHRFASSRQQRRVLFDDWREQHGVRMPHRRIYVDAAGRATTTLELRRISARRVSERDFRLL
jgi:hypothetical protein